MRNFLLCIAFVLSPFFLKAQLFIVNSPASLQGAYQFGTAEFGAQLTDSVYMGSLMLMDDMVTTVTDGCEQTTQDFTGFWVVIDRGTCEFGLKVLQAENQGANGVIILNNNPGEGLFGMLAGAVGDQVTIPSLFLSFEDGALIKEVLEEGTPITISAGNLVFPNDISTTRAGAGGPFTGTIDQLMWEGLSQTFTPGVRVINNGTNTATNVSATGIINFEGNEVYSESVITPADTIAPGDTVFLAMPQYTFSSENVGNYTLDYQLLSDSTDELAFDNTTSTAFSVTEDIVCKGSWNFVDNLPNRTGAIRAADAGVFEYVAGFNTPTEGLVLDKLTYYMTTNSTTETLFDKPYEIWLYAWQDASEDGLAQLEELNRVGLAIPSFGEGSPADSWATDDLIGVTTPKVITTAEDDGYFVGVKFETGDSLSIGTNSGNNISFADGLGLLETHLDFPHFAVNMFESDIPNLVESGPFAETGYPLAMAIHIAAEVNATNEPELAGTINLFPNPASDNIQVELVLEELADEVTYDITDITGRLLYTVTQKNVQHGNTSFDVSQLPAGTYQMTVKDGKGIKTVSFSKI